MKQINMLYQIRLFTNNILKIYGGCYEIQNVISYFYEIENTMENSALINRKHNKISSRGISNHFKGEI